MLPRLNSLNIHNPNIKGVMGEVKTTLEQERPNISVKSKKIMPLVISRENLLTFKKNLLDLYNPFFSSLQPIFSMKQEVQH